MSSFCGNGSIGAEYGYGGGGRNKGGAIRGGTRLSPPLRSFGLTISPSVKAEIKKKKHVS